MLLQFVIVNEQANEGDGVRKTWEFIKRYWKLTPPKLIISILYDRDDGFIYRKQLWSMLYNLLLDSDPVTAEGKHLAEINFLYLRRRGHCTCSYVRITKV